MSQPSPTNQPPKPPPFMKNIVLFILIITSLVGINSLLESQNSTKDIQFSEFMADVEDGRIEEITIEGQTITGTYKKAGDKFVTVGPIADFNLRSQLEEKGVRVNYAHLNSGSYWKTFLVDILPLLFLLGLFIFIIRQIQVGGGKAMNFGKSRARMMMNIHPKVTFADIAGIDEAKEELGEIVEFLKDPEKFTKLGARIPRGVLLIGSPGTGKTILAKGVAGEAGVPFFSISGSDFVEMFVGVGASRVRDLFEQAKKHAPCIIFIDEIDAVGRQRGAGLGGGHDEREQTLNQLLVEMDGFEDNEGVIVVAASNRADVLDPALLRPGRFDRRVIVPKPDVKGRLGILQVHAKKSPLTKNTDLAKIAQGTPGFSGADLENLVNEAALIAARGDATKLHMSHFELAKDKILMGPERRSMIMREREKKITSYHEAGHALVGLHLPNHDPIHKVTIIPRGQALGVTITLPEDDRLTVTKQFAENMIAYAMGGRAAEELVFNHRTTGASDDINKATDIARKMVCQWGMSEVVGPQSLNDRHGQDVFLGRDFSQSQHISEAMHTKIDSEISKFLRDGYAKALDILTTHRDTLEAMAEALLIKETLLAQDLKALLDRKDVITPKERDLYNERLKTDKKPLFASDKEGTFQDEPVDSDDSKGENSTAKRPTTQSPASKNQNPSAATREASAHDISASDKSSDEAPA
ncbi:MAG: ATP-dependent zinc metalloprotease FtsH [Proteobacteria bacterium]|nr:ATP-dependent zinc metalloprotease FtsH [Pseudomonadota bacterium]